jgi:hypothetical protein
MAYTVKPYQLAYYRDNQWAETPAQMIQPLLVRTLQQTGFFQAILSPPDSGHASYALRTEIMELTQDYTGIPPQVSHLDVVRPAEDVESALPPLVPDRRKQHASVPAIGGEHGHER